MPPSAAAVPAPATAEEEHFIEEELDPRYDPDMTPWIQNEIIPLVDVSGLYRSGRNPPRNGISSPDPDEYGVSSPDPDEYDSELNADYEAYLNEGLDSESRKGVSSPDPDEYDSELNADYDAYLDAGLDSELDSSNPDSSTAAGAQEAGRTSNQPAAAPRGREGPAPVAVAVLAAASRKRKAPTGPPPPSRPFKRQQYVSPPRPMWKVRSDAKFGPPTPAQRQKLPKLRHRNRYYPDPLWSTAPSQAVNGYDAVKKHFDVAHARWEVAVEKMDEKAHKMVNFGEMLLDEAHARHRWVGQVGTQTWGEDGRMKSYEAFKGALKKVQEMAKKAEEKQVEDDAKKWTIEFAQKRKNWGEEEISATEESEESEESEEGSE